MDGEKRASLAPLIFAFFTAGAYNRVSGPGIGQLWRLVRNRKLKSILSLNVTLLSKLLPSCGCDFGSIHTEKRELRGSVARGRVVLAILLLPFP